MISAELPLIHPYKGVRKPLFPHCKSVNTVRIDNACATKVFKRQLTAKSRRFLSKKGLQRPSFHDEHRLAAAGIGEGTAGVQQRRQAHHFSAALHRHRQQKSPHSGTPTAPKTHAKQQIANQKRSCEEQKREAHRPSAKQRHLHPRKTAAHQ